MTFALPTVNNAHEVVVTSNPLFDVGINSPTTGNRTAGNLPITLDASQMTITTDGQLSGIQFFFQTSPASYDVSTSTKLLLWHNQFNAPNRIQVNDLANGGVRMRLTSGTTALETDYKEWNIGGNDSPFAECIKGQVPFVIDLNAGNATATAGTFDNTDVTRYAILINTDFVVGTSGNWNFMASSFVLGTEKGDADIPVFTGTSSFTDAVTLVQGTDYTNKIGNWIRQTGSVVFIDMPFQIGDNSTSTDFNDNGLTIVSPANNDATDPRFQLTDQAMQVHFNLLDSFTDVATLSGNYLWGTRAKFNLNQTNNALISLNGTIFKGMGEISLGGSVVANNPVTFDNTGTVILKSSLAYIYGSSFKNTFGAHALQLEGGSMDIDTLRFESYSSGHAILIDTAGTYNLTDIFFDQSGFGDIELTHTTGTVTINLIGTTTIPTITNTGGGTLVLNYPDRFITLNNIVADSRVYVFDTTNNVELFNEIPAFQPFTGTITSDGNDVELLIRVRNASGAIPYKNFVTTTTLTSAGVNLNINQVEDL